MLPKEKLEALYNKGLSMNEIALKEGWSYDKVRYWAKKYGVLKRTRREISFYAYWNRQTGTRPKGLLNVNEIKELYYQKELSVPQIAKILKRSDRVIYKFMECHNLDRRNASETNAIIFKRQKPSYCLKENFTFPDRMLKLAGIMLYWAEGYKTPAGRNSTLDLANSDPMMIMIFLKFLRSICGVDENRLRVQLYCYANQNVEALKSYWSEVTRIPLNQFIKPYIRQDFSETKKNKMKYGLIHIRYSDKKLFLQVQNWIKEYLNSAL